VSSLAAQQAEKKTDICRKLWLKPGNKSLENQTLTSSGGGGSNAVAVIIIISITTYFHF